MKMPSFNIFLIMNSPEKKEKKKKEKEDKENKLGEALKVKDEEMIAQVTKMAAKMGNTSHVGGS